jgi:release factor glutamine methyltransferase
VTVAPAPSWAAVRAEVAGLLAAAERLEPEVRADAMREAQWLLEAALGWTPATRAAQLLEGAPPAAEAVAHVRRVAARRVAGEPLAYCVGTAAFRHLELQVDPRVLIPRPETERVVEVALACVADRPGGVAVDIGTGSGAIALSLATEGRFDQVVATDVSADALTVARANAEQVAARRTGGHRMAPVVFKEGAHWAPLAGVQARVIVSNPPYIAYDEAAALPSSVRDWEPAVALFAADGGMACLATLLAGAAAHLEPEGWLVLEVDAQRAAVTAVLARDAGLVAVEVVRDWSDRDRVLRAQRPPWRRDPAG